VPNTATVRAERSGNSSGCVYTLTVRCTDSSDNASTGTADAPSRSEFEPRRIQEAPGGDCGVASRSRRLRIRHRRRRDHATGAASLTIAAKFGSTGDHQSERTLDLCPVDSERDHGRR